MSDCGNVACQERERERGIHEAVENGKHSSNRNERGLLLVPIQALWKNQPTSKTVFS